MLARFGGPPGIRDVGLLESALNCLRQIRAYGQPNIFDLAAPYAHGIVRNHPFVDGNKRTAFMAAYVFLAANGYRLTCPEAEAVVFVRDLAAGTLAEAEFAVWLARNAAFKD